MPSQKSELEEIHLQKIQLQIIQLQKIQLQDRGQKREAIEQELSPFDVRGVIPRQLSPVRGSARYASASTSTKYMSNAISRVGVRV